MSLLNPRTKEVQPKVIYQGNWTELQRRRNARKRLGLSGEPIPPAPVGRHHRDYGMTVAEHLSAKGGRK